jgi:hypothetical protein
MIGGAALSERESAHACEWAARPGVAGPGASERGRARVGRARGWAASAGERNRARLGRTLLGRAGGEGGVGPSCRFGFSFSNM